MGDAGNDELGPVERSGERNLIVPRFDFRVDYAKATSKGAQRARNQDAMGCFPRHALFVIADGMGGHAGGEVAAATAIEAVQGYLSGERARRRLEKYAATPDLEARRAVFELMVRALEKAHEAVLAKAKAEPELAGMGTTLDAVVLVRDRAFIAHVGDGRIFLVRPTATLQLTHDHALYDSLRSSGKRSAAKAQSPLTNTIGNSGDVMVDTLFVDLGATDRLVMCTDGVYGPLDGENVFNTTCRRGSPGAVCEALIQSARRAGSVDDASVIVLHTGRRFVQRDDDAGLRAHDMGVLASSPLLDGLSVADVLSTLAAGVEVEIEPGEQVPCAVASDRVAYLVLDGIVKLPSGSSIGPSGMLMAASLLDVPVRGELPVVDMRARLLRIRHDDFNEVCSHAPRLAAELYKRIARHLAREAR